MTNRYLAAIALAAAIGTGCVTKNISPDKSFDFALIGDVPYNAEQATNLFPNLMRELNGAKLEFVVHDGDIKSGETPCTDEIFEARRKDFADSAHPFIYIFGDNEWTDCARATNGFAPEERLQKLREIFCADELSLGTCAGRWAE
jgi:hypothetical protein